MMVPFAQRSSCRQKSFIFSPGTTVGQAQYKITEQRTPVFRTDTGFSGNHVYLMICADTVNAKYSG